MAIVLEDVSKTYEVKGRKVEALKRLSLTVEEGEIFGIIGFSGAGKSTLLRLINLLEQPSSGSVSVNGTELGALSGEKLRTKRKKIGMIFQQFNLIESKTVYQNIEFVLKASKYEKKEVKSRIEELLALVGLSDKADSYPGNLSGGQKQRVGIARALANHPEVLLCDEATSALDPDTTKTILKLLKKINRELGITIVLITHEMEVIKEIADRVGVMTAGEIVEESDVYSIFSHPGHAVTKGFVQDIYDFSIPPHIQLNDNSDVITIKFLNENAEANYVNQLYRHFDCDISILNGRIEYIQDMPLGFLMLHVQGEAQEITRLKAFIDESKGIERAEIYAETI
ncbi:methionine ABC transporter ATP-binding protein [Salinicoccus hispanicus]|uniref:ATP-binding cassette domain-containing protein n=1 Tax=Salinicoccus hispanicus TaxID=157225 RepID=A0A6N8U2X2_9STAP|nr:ATP-binding cassette domain-containing protein [Salinicoccus hispanicus]MXQ50019.1 ATP-binding cassette domain-containing protein [Salinicoccus hispanicus]